MKKNISAKSPSDKHPQLTILSHKIIEKKDDLSNNLDKIMALNIIESEFLEAIEIYTDTLQDLWEFAKELGLNGFCEICTFINDNIFECSFKSNRQKKPLHKQLNLWPQLVLKYLLSPELGTKDIVAYIRKDNWPITASKKHAEHIAVLLVKDYAIGIIETKPIKPKIKPENNPIENKNSIQELASELSSKQIEQAINTDNKIIGSDTETPKNLYGHVLNEAEIFDITALIKDDLPLIAGSLDIASDIEALISDTPKQAFNPNLELPILPVMTSISAIDVDDDIMDSEDIEPLLSNMGKNFGIDNVTKKTDNEFSIGDIIIENTNLDDIPNITNIEIPTMEEFENNIEKITKNSMVSEEIIQVTAMNTENLEENNIVEKPINLDELTTPNIYQDNLIIIDSTAEFPDSELLEKTEDIPNIQANLTISEDGLENTILDDSEIPEINLSEEKIVIDELLDLQEEITDDELENTILDDSEIPEINLSEEEIVDESDKLLDEKSEEIDSNIQNDLTMPEIVPEELKEIIIEKSVSENIIYNEPIIDDSGEKLDSNLIKDENSNSEFKEPDHLNIISSQDEESVEIIIPEIESIPLLPKVNLANEDIIELLIGQLVDIEEGLAENSVKLISAEDDDLLMAVSDYTELVQSVWDAAEMANLVGLQEICTFVNDNVMAIGNLSLEDRSKTQEILTAWPLLTVAYLQDPANQVQPLTSHLQNELWPSPSEIDWLVNLLPNTETVEELHTEIELPEPEILITQEISLADDGTIELIVGQLIDLKEELTTTATQILNTEAEDLLLAISTYTEYVQSIWDIAEMANLTGLQDVCTFINNNVMELGGQSIETRGNAQELLLAWPDLIITYLQTPNQSVEALLTHLQQWPTPPENITELKQHLIPTLKTIELAASDVLELVRSQIVDLTEGLSAALEIYMSMKNDNPDLLEAIEKYTNKVQEIWDVAEMANLIGLQEVCTFINDNLMLASQQDNKLASQPQFISWPTKVLEYLTTPETGATELVNFLQESTWPTPLDADTSDKLLISLTTPANVEEISIEEELIPEVPVADLVENLPPSNENLIPLSIEVNTDISLGNAEVVEILTGELEFAKEDLAKELDRIMTSDNVEAVENYTEQVQRLNIAAEMVGLDGLQTVCTFIIDNVMAVSTLELTNRSTAKSVLEGWPNLLLGYFTSPTTGVLPLVEHFRLSAWQQPLNDEAATVLATQLIAGSSADEEEEDEANKRQIQASPEDVVLNIPEDINPELLEAYLQETPQHAQEFSEAIQNIIQGADVSEIERAQRLAHTLKGSSNIIGIKGIASMGHHLEDTLEYLAKHKVTPPKELTDTMVEAADCIEMMVDSLLGQDDAPEQALQVLQSVLDWANRIDKGKLDAPPIPTQISPATTAVTSEAKPKDKTPAKKTAKPAATGEVEQFLRVPTKTVDELMRLVGELSISLGQIQERMRHVVHNTRLLTEQDLILHEKTFELENLVDIRGITGIGSDNKQTSQDDENFDPLEFEEYNELHSVAHSFIESIADNRELTLTIQEDLVDLDTMLIRQERLNKDFQTNIMTTRMVPASTLLSKLQRNVRQTCRSTGKKAELEISGTDILMDSDVVSNLGDPLQHILRNSIDHGLETAEERVMLGKPKIGTIKLDFYREGNNIVVKCQDDGQGLNYTNIRYSAIQRGLITEDQELSEKELSRLILMSGFSTKSGVTQMSGRGVGMDVVHTSIKEMKGTLDLISETGKGTTIIIKLPMTLVTVHVLLIRVGELRFGIPSNTLERALAAGISEFYKVGEELTLKIDKDVYALKSLADLLHIKGDKEFIDEQEERPIILVHEETGVTAVVIDELLDTHDLVMKNMGSYVKDVRGVSGASILGDGSLIPLLDIPELLRSPIKMTMRPIENQEDAEDARANIPNIMIVDDSLSVRKSLSLLVEDAGFNVLLAKDGVEAIEVMNQTQPNIMLVDMEMPRMNGLELTAHVRANQATQNLPIFMITSRTTEKHKNQAKSAGVSAYLTKPYQETELLDLIDNALAS
ncbi:MAG: response regulator [Candidatus Marithrix sp.]